MRQYARLASLAMAGLFVVAGLEAQAAKSKAPAPRALAAAPKMEVSPETKDAGTVAKGQVVDAVFVVKNTGGSDLIISDARPSCGCTVASFDKIIDKNGKVIGASMFAGYSYNERSMLSLGVVDPDIQIGDDLMLVWGEENGGTTKPTVERHRQVEIRATVQPAPISEVARVGYRPKGAVSP